MERGSEYLIANSSGAANYTVLEGGKLERKYLEGLNNPAILDAFEWRSEQKSFKKQTKP